MTSIAHQLEDLVGDAGAEALHTVALRVLEDAKRNVPVGDPGIDPDPNVSLADSGSIEKNGDGWIIAFDTPYAAKVHEDLRLSHPRGGGPKFLERAITQIVPTLERIVASEVEARMASGLRSNAARPR